MSVLSATEGIVLLAAGTAAAAAVACFGLPWVVRKFQPDAEVPNLLETDARIAAMFFGIFNSADVEENGADSHRSDDAAAPDDKDGTYRRQLVAYDEVKRAYNFQRRITGPALRAMDLPKSINAIQRLTQQKEFAWIAVSNDRWHIGLGLLQFHFIGVMVVNIYDTASKESWKQKVELPLSDVFGFGPHFVPGTNGCCAPASAGHRITFSHRSMLLGTHTASILFTGSSAVVSFKTHVTADHQAGKHRGGAGVSRSVQAQFEVSLPADHLNMVYPIGPHRASMVSKFAGAPTCGTSRLRWGDDANNDLGPWIDLQEELPPHSNSNSNPATIASRRRRSLQPLLGALDYTRGLLRRETTWYWSCLSTYAAAAVVTTEVAEGRPAPSLGQHSINKHIALGWHLSAGTYDTDVVGANGMLSLEGTLFVDGTVHLVRRPVLFRRVNAGGATKEDPSCGRTTRWTVSTEGSVVGSRPHSSGNDTKNRDDDVQVDVTFEPIDGHLGTFNYVVVKGALLHYWGTYNGSVCVRGATYSIKDAPGVLEDHFARW